MLVASVGLIPGQSEKPLGMEILTIGIAVMLISTMAQTRSHLRHKHQPIEWWLPRLIISLITAPPITVGGLLMVSGLPYRLYWVAGGLVISTAAGVLNTWVLLVEVLR
jgi:hypothetical protein